MTISARLLPAALLAAVLLPALAASPAHAQKGEDLDRGGMAPTEDDDVPPDPNPDDPWVPGSEWVYTVTWQGVPCGTAVIRVGPVVEYRDRSCYRVTAVTRANAYINAIFPVEDSVETWVDVETGLSLKFVKSLREGDFRRDEHIVFDRTALGGDGTATWLRRDFDEPGVHMVEKAVVECDDKVHDPFSVVFWALERAAAVKEGDPLEVRVAADRDVWDVALVADGVEDIFLGDDLGTIAAMHVMPDYDYEGMFLRSSKDVHLWVDRERGVPVRVRADVTLGAIQLDLVRRRIPGLDEPAEGEPDEGARGRREGRGGR